MIRKLFIFITLLILTLNCAFAKIDIVYPTSRELNINAQSIFFIGNTDYNSVLTINSKPVKLWENNFFVHVVPLEYGKNEINITSKNNGNTETLKYHITRNKLSSGGYKPQPLQKNNDGEILYTTTVKDNATVRELPSNSSNRLVELPKNVVLYVSGKKGDFYKIDESGENEYWIHKSNINQPEKVHQKIEAIVTDTKFYSDDKYNYAKFYLTLPVMYTVKQNGNSIELTLYGIKTIASDGKTVPNYTFKFDTVETILGYDCYYENDYLLFRIAKVPESFDERNPLNGISIFIDPGHGGNEKGSVGPTRVAEKDVNLGISKFLIAELNKSGANVSTSRTDDSQVKLYDRVKMAKDNNALISISIHSNALPNGKDPYVSHGTEVHYYNENSKMLAEIIKNNLVQDLKLKDNGIHRSSFALNRSTNPVSVLVEVAYMINPEEYILLKNVDFQKKVALSIKKSIENYIYMIEKQKL